MMPVFKMIFPNSLALIFRLCIQTQTQRERQCVLCSLFKPPNRRWIWILRDDGIIFVSIKVLQKRLNGKAIIARLCHGVKHSEQKPNLVIMRLTWNVFRLFNIINNAIEKSITLPLAEWMNEWMHGLDKILIENRNKHICKHNANRSFATLQ